MADGLTRAWIEPRSVDVPQALGNAVGGHPLVAETLARRGLTTLGAAIGFLDPQRYQPASPWELPGMDRAVERLVQAVQHGERVCVWGDFDVDGQVATTLLVATLRSLGADVIYHIPVRSAESHGISVPALEQVLKQNVRVVLTCDTGVTAHEAVAHAQMLGVDVIVTDHHELPPSLPAAYSVLNPKRLPDDHPLHELCGVGCAYKLAEALYAQVGRSGEVEQYLDLVALGIVADVATQIQDTRYLLQRGLAALRNSQRPALRAMIDMAELNPQWLTEEHIGFVLAPRLNALGRLGDANRAVEFLSTTDMAQARITAAELEGLNAQRKLLTDQVTQAAISQIERDPALLETAALVVSGPGWPSGVVGIVAGRLAARYNRPAVVILTPPGELARGSARSVAGCNITKALAASAHLLDEFGGHPMAAGFSMEAGRVGELRRALSRSVLEMCGPPGGNAPLQIDGYLALSDLSLELVEELERMAPFGLGNEPLVLATRGLRLLQDNVVGRNSEHLQLMVEDERGTLQRVIWWQGAALREVGLPLPEGHFDLAYVVRASDYRGVRAVQVEWVDARPTEEQAAAGRAPAPAIAVVDYRHVGDPRRALEELRSKAELQVWREGENGIEGVDRLGLGGSPRLAIWTVPPGPQELSAALEQAAPETVYLFGVPAGLGDADSFLARLAGLVKYALNTLNGAVRISALAAVTAHREATVRMGMAWLAARGYIEVQSGEGDLLLLGPGGQVVQADEAARTAVRLQELLEETAAYRRSFARVPAETLLA